VKGLLDAYLVQDPEAAALARQFDNTADLAKEAMEAESDVRLPPLPFSGMLRAERKRHRRRHLATAAGLAVSMLVGLALGMALSRQEPAKTPGDWPIARRDATLVVKPGRGPSAERSGAPEAPGFWSFERLRKRGLAAGRAAPGRSIQEVPPGNRASEPKHEVHHRESMWEIGHETSCPDS
jgi:hypothetical protein